MNAEMWAIVEQCNSELILSKGKFLRLGVLSRADQAEALHQQFLVNDFLFFHTLLLKLYFYDIFKEWIYSFEKRNLEKNISRIIFSYVVFSFLFFYQVLSFFIPDAPWLDGGSREKDDQNGEKIEDQTGRICG